MFLLSLLFLLLLFILFMSLPILLSFLLFDRLLLTLLFRVFLPFLPFIINFLIRFMWLMWWWLIWWFLNLLFDYLGWCLLLFSLFVILSLLLDLRRRCFFTSLFGGFLGFQLFSFIKDSLMAFCAVLNERDGLLGAICFSQVMLAYIMLPISFSLVYLKFLTTLYGDLLG